LIKITLVRSLCILALIGVCIGCSNPSKNNFDDEQAVTIANLQDRRVNDSLVSFLYSDKTEYRRAAALAMGSVQDTTAIDTLGRLATPDLQTRINAAFALGQMYNNKSMKWLLYGELGDEPQVRREIFEAMGKVASKDELAMFPSKESDFNVIDGIAWGIYRAGLRGITDSVSVNRAALILLNHDANPDGRLAAAHFFSRTAFKPQPDVADALMIGSQNESPEIRMASVSAFAKLKPEESIEWLMRAVDDRDYRVRVNAARALRSQPWLTAKPLYEKLLADSNAHVNVAAAEVISGSARESETVLAWAQKAVNWRAQATLYECYARLEAVQGNSLQGFSDELHVLYTRSSNPYQQAALLSPLMNSNRVDLVVKQVKESASKVIKSTAASVLARANKRDDILSKYLAGIYQEIIKDGDHGAIIYACSALMDTTLSFKKLITDYSFLEEAKAKLSLPRDYETYVPLEETLNYFKGLPPPPPLKNEYNHPIDWKLAATISKDQKVVIETTKGKIVMQLFINEAPGSVVNFVKLVNDKYYDGKYFHRVVPNFVIQTGCDRGDGFGSLDYSIRSEFTTRKYKTGSVGMASAGKDTEGTQWFITHSPTPHLDGKYTIFAEVIEGMDIVHKIEVGDQIISAHLAD
jgi:cyclophilin family peptidyl-prolyl cis-trans isomerase/HEAT repeat protein